jgi:hypothetical protein
LTAPNNKKVNKRLVVSAFRGFVKQGKKARSKDRLIIRGFFPERAAKAFSNRQKSGSYRTRKDLLEFAKSALFLRRRTEK